METKRQVFYSFHYELDHWRAAQVRNIGIVEGNRAFSDNAWEQVKRGGNAAIERWIDGQMQYRSCTVVLVGAGTAGRKWINYEIIKSWKKGMGVVGICIHGLKNQYGDISRRGRNPFDLRYGERNLSRMIRCYDPQGRTSEERHAWISQRLSNVIEEAIQIRKDHG